MEYKVEHEGLSEFDLVKQKLERTFNSGIEFAIGFRIDPQFYSKKHFKSELFFTAGRF